MTTYTIWEYTAASDAAVGHVQVMNRHERGLTAEAATIAVLTWQGRKYEMRKIGRTWWLFIAGGAEGSRWTKTVLNSKRHHKQDAWREIVQWFVDDGYLPGCPYILTDQQFIEWVRERINESGHDPMVSATADMPKILQNLRILKELDKPKQ